MIRSPITRTSHKTSGCHQILLNLYFELFLGVEVKVEVKKFLFTLNKILDREMELEADGELDINDDVEIPPETLLPKPLVSMFSSEIVQMKSSKSLNEACKQCILLSLEYACYLSCYSNICINY